jgi:hypothetical protein
MPSRYLLVLLLTLIFFVSAASASETRDWEFTVMLGEREIGTHRFSLREHDGARELVSEAEFDVKVLFLNAYRYRHRAVERWESGCLVSIHATTDDNGEHMQVRGHSRDDVFAVHTGDGKTALPACVRSFAYWNRDLLQTNRLLNAQTGEYEPVTVRRTGTERMTVRGMTLDAKRYVIEGRDYSISLWYSPDNEWLALETGTDSGEPLRYQIR